MHSVNFFVLCLIIFLHFHVVVAVAVSGCRCGHCVYRSGILSRSEHVTQPFNLFEGSSLGDLGLDGSHLGRGQADWRCGWWGSTGGSWQRRAGHKSFGAFFDFMKLLFAFLGFEESFGF